MKLLLKSKVQNFFDVNGMDVLNATSIPTVEIINGAEWVSEDAAVKYVYESYFEGLSYDLVSFCKN